MCTLDSINSFTTRTATNYITIYNYARINNCILIISQPTPTECTSTFKPPTPYWITPKIVVPNWKTRSVEVDCLFNGSRSPSNYIEHWNHTHNLISKNSPKYATRMKTINICTFKRTLFINNVSTLDKGNYSCYSQSIAGSKNASITILQTELGKCHTLLLLYFQFGL